MGDEIGVFLSKSGPHMRDGDSDRGRNDADEARWEIYGNLLPVRNVSLSYLLSLIKPHKPHFYTSNKSKVAAAVGWPSRRSVPE